MGWDWMEQVGFHYRHLPQRLQTKQRKRRDRQSAHDHRLPVMAGSGSGLLGGMQLVWNARLHVPSHRVNSPTRSQTPQTSSCESVDSVGVAPAGNAYPSAYLINVRYAPLPPVPPCPLSLSPTHPSSDSSTTPHRLQ